MDVNGPKVAVFGTNRIRPTFVYFEGPTAAFEDKLEEACLAAKAKKQNHIMVDAQTAFYVDDFFEYNKVIKEWDFKPYRRMRILFMHEFIASIKHRKTFIQK